MNLENINFYLSILAPIFTLLCTTVVFLEKFVKNKKLKKILEKTEKITKEMIPLVKEAEGFINFSGVEKKEYVMTKLAQYALENHIKFNREELSEKIEEIINLTKEVNVGGHTFKETNEKGKQIENKIKSIIEGMKE